MLKLSDIHQRQLEGVPGEAILYKPVSDLMAGIEDQFRPDGMLSTLNRMASYGDERSKVLLAALATESVIDKVLESLMPQYRSLFDNVPFSIKSKVLRALAIVPNHLLDAANIIGAIRNKFAHNLTVEQLGDLGSNVKDKMKNYYAERKIDPQDKREDLGHVFDAVALIATVGLSAYLPLVRDLNEAIREPAFEAKLRKRAEKRQGEQVKIVLEHVRKPAPASSGPF